MPFFMHIPTLLTNKPLITFCTHKFDLALVKLLNVGFKILCSFTIYRTMGTCSITLLYHWNIIRFRHFHFFLCVSDNSTFHVSTFPPPTPCPCSSQISPPPPYKQLKFHLTIFPFCTIPEILLLISVYWPPVKKSLP